MPQIGPEGQARLGQARVACIGAGGVKSPMLYYLAAAGIGHLRIIDFDTVELSNLNRQILYGTADVGRPKAEAAAARLRGLNDEITVEPVAARVATANVAALLDGFDIVIEGGDSPQGRRLVNDYCVQARTPMVHASAQYNYGYLLTVLPARSACFHCVFPDLPEGHGGSVPVMGIATGLVGVLGAGEVVKLITGVGRIIADGYLVISAFLGTFDFIPAPRRADCPSCVGIDAKPTADH